MRVYHVTLLSNKPGIMREGIDPGYSRGARQECWFVTPALLPWAMLHVMNRYRVSLAEIVAFEVLIPARKLTRRRRGIYTCQEVVAPLFVVQSVDVGGVAESYPVLYDEGMMQGG